MTTDRGILGLGRVLDHASDGTSRSNTQSVDRNEDLGRNTTADVRLLMTEMHHQGR